MKHVLIVFAFYREINLRLLKDNIELFFKKESNFKRPMKIEMIFAKLTKGFVPHYEWNGHRRRIPWKVLKKDQTVNKFPSAFFTTKTGLHQSLLQLHWYSPFPVSSFFPRCYQVSSNLIVLISQNIYLIDSCNHWKLPSFFFRYFGFWVFAQILCQS